MDTLDKEFWEKREAAMKRFMAAKERKKARVAEITKSLCEEYKERSLKEKAQPGDSHQRVGQIKRRNIKEKR